MIGVTLQLVQNIEHPERSEICGEVQRIFAVFSEHIYLILDLREVLNQISLSNGHQHRETISGNEVLLCVEKKLDVTGLFHKASVLQHALSIWRDRLIDVIVMVCVKNRSMILSDATHDWLALDHADVFFHIKQFVNQSIVAVQHRI